MSTLHQYQKRKALTQWTVRKKLSLRSFSSSRARLLAVPLEAPSSPAGRRREGVRGAGPGGGRPMSTTVRGGGGGRVREAGRRTRRTRRGRPPPRLKSGAAVAGDSPTTPSFPVGASFPRPLCLRPSRTSPAPQVRGLVAPRGRTGRP